jgi:hypothetical protein
MKQILTLVLCGVIPSLLPAQAVIPGVVAAPDTNSMVSPDYAVVARAADSRQWAKIVASTDSAGEATFQTNISYTEVGANLCVRDALGRWSDASSALASVADGASSVNSPMAAHFAGNANAAGGTVRFRAADGKVFVCKVYGITFYSPELNTNILVASLQDCQGQLVGSNHIYYPNAFNGLNADLWFSYSPSGIDQDIVIHENPPSPSAYGLNPQTVRMQIFTEWFSPPEPRKITAEDDGIINDAWLDFGNLLMRPGAALFTQGQGDGAPVEAGPIYKHWGKIEGGNGRDWLVEEIRYTLISNILQTLPLHASAEKPGRSLFEAIAATQPLSPKPGEDAVSAPIQVAKGSPRPVGLILDWSMVSSVQNFVFQSDTTYYVSTNVIMSGTNTTWEQGTILKFASGAGLTVNSPVCWQGTPYMPVILCAKDDNGAGDVVLGSTGNPGTAYYANPALYFNATNANTNLILHDLRVLNAKTAIAINGNSNHILSNVQMVNCGNGVAATNTTYSLWNGLMYKVLTNFTGSNSTGDVEQLTSDTASKLGTNQTLNLTNCLLVAVTNTGPFASNSVYTANSGSGVFQTVGGGFHYLPTNSPYLGAGTTNIAQALAAALPRLTTYAPNLLSNNFSANTTLTAVVPLDTGIPAIGFHYYPMDYIAHNLTVNAGVTLTLTNGVGIGFMDVTGITIRGNLVSQGSPVKLNTLMSVMAVQETFLTSELYFLLIGGNGSWQNLYFRFTDLPNPGGGQAAQLWMLENGGGTAAAGPITLRDSQMRAGRLFLDLGNVNGETGSETVNLTNNLFERAVVYFWRSPNMVGSDYVPANLVVNADNNLFHWGYMTTIFDMASYEKGTPTNPCPLPWSIFNNLFQVATNQFSEVGTDSLGGGVWPTLIANGYNGYLTATNFQASLGGDKKTFSAADFQVGALGNFYYPTSGTGLAQLIFAGSPSAANIGLYHYTVTTNNVVDGTQLVSIGYHFVAADGNGNPLDSNGNGIPDYLEDANGNGVFDAGDLGSWLAYLPDTGGLINLQVFTPMQ